MHLVKFTRKDFISLKDVSSGEINYILKVAETMKHVIAQKNKRAAILNGKSVITLFGNTLSRNKISYDLAAGYLGANVVEMKLGDEGGDLGNLIDLGRIIDQMGGDFIIIRHPMSGSAKLLAESALACVINAGDGINENPTQSLLDLLTIKEQKGGFKNLKVSIIGDVMHSRVARSNIWALTTLGARVSVIGPPTLIPDFIDSLGVKIFYNAYEGVESADVILSLKLQPERQYGSLMPSTNEYRNLFKIDSEMLSYAKPDVIVMHPGPINRGIEISSQIIGTKNCLIDDQITNGVAVRMALLYLLSMGGNPINEAFN
ncbi:MAG: aspartate carbamoyltransferase catalytic subunit [Clostridiales bacterium]|jgi:aspartate carbamoyltransferase catalytic subunit|nr:aspartate carbamoyltransferase catalytic subunit [Clostridiales bacterium]